MLCRARDHRENAGNPGSKKKKNYKSRVPYESACNGEVKSSSKIGSPGLRIKTSGKQQLREEKEKRSGIQEVDDRKARNYREAEDNTEEKPEKPGA